MSSNFHIAEDNNIYETFMICTAPRELSGKVDVRRTKYSDDTFIDSGGNFGREKHGLMLKECKHEREMLGARFICGHVRREIDIQSW